MENPFWQKKIESSPQLLRQLAPPSCAIIFAAKFKHLKTDRLASQIGNAIALAHPEWQFAWIVSADGMGNSLRSSNGFDVSVVAQQMGGGGHKAATGFATCLNVATK
jgi:oligoribonuclease NrnB/cAMP/cGMP phosphodiesterase (DHH superfamily)